VTIQDVRGGSGGNTYSFSYALDSNGFLHLSAITNSLYTAEAYTFTYSTWTLQEPFDGQSGATYGLTAALASITQTPTNMTTTFSVETYWPA